MFTPHVSLSEVLNASHSAAVYWCVVVVGSRSGTTERVAHRTTGIGRVKLSVITELIIFIITLMLPVSAADTAGDAASGRCARLTRC